MEPESGEESKSGEGGMESERGVESKCGEGGEESESGEGGEEREREEEVVWVVRIVRCSRIREW